VTRRNKDMSRFLYKNSRLPNVLFIKLVIREKDRYIHTHKASRLPSES
jgi:hypothetical protein